MTRWPHGDRLTANELSRHRDHRPNSALVALRDNTPGEREDDDYRRTR